jgi:FkbM family methyltransferase
MLGDVDSFGGIGKSRAVAIAGRIRTLSLRLGGYGALRALERVTVRRREVAAELAFLRSMVKTGALCFDVGANRGQSCEMYLLLGARVVAYEPQVALHSEIRARCARLGSLTLQGEALGAAREQRRFFLKSYDQVASFDAGWGGEVVGEEVVQVSTLDEQIELHGVPDYCKIDVEGWELETLRGLSRPLPLVSFEYHLFPQDVAKACECLARLMQLGNCTYNVRTAGSHQFCYPMFRPLVGVHQVLADPGLASRADYGEVYVRCATR